jgi:cardiolipin synthase C
LRTLALALLGLLLATGALRAAPFDTSPLGASVAAAFTGVDSKETSLGNQLAVISGGYDALLLRVHLIRNARTSISIQTFIWTNDECGRLLMYELIEAARRGVKVRIIADHMVSNQDPETIAFLATAHPNLQIKHYRPAMSRMKPTFVHTILATLQSFHAVNQRMHNKVMVFDDAIMITGGRNIENTYYDHSTELNFRDRDVLAVGPVTHDATASFEEFWNFRQSASSRDLSDVEAVITKGKFRRYETRADYEFGSYFIALDREANDSVVIGTRFGSRLKLVQKVSFICDEPGKSSGFLSNTAKITRELRHTLEEAKSAIVMQTPYLVLSERAQKLFHEMQDKNPALRIRVSSNSFASTDNLLAYSANYRLRNAYVESLKLEIHEFKPQPGSLPALFTQYQVISQLAAARIAAGKQTREPFMCMHAKSLVVDDRIAFVGSYNLDPRSESLNTEAGLLVEDDAFAHNLREEIERDMRAENSWVIARRAIPLHLDVINSLVGGLLALGPIDLWPVQNTSSFELLRGAAEVPPDDPAFHKNYREVGSFPGTEGVLSQKEILTRIYKAVGAPLTPVL